MQNTSALYKQLLANPRHTMQTRVDIDGQIYGEDFLESVHTDSAVFPGENPEVGGCVAREITLLMLKPPRKIPRAAKLEPYVRLCLNNQVSEWLPKGKFYIDTREDEDIHADCDGISIHGYCDMRKAEDEGCPIDGLDWPARDIDVVRLIAGHMGVELDTRTVAAMNKGYLIEIPVDYSSREVLSGIAAMYGGCFIMSDAGQLLLIQLDSLPAETHYLVSSSGNAITFGGVRILV